MIMYINMILATPKPGLLSNYWNEKNSATLRKLDVIC